jgi:hypothetical protein
MAHGGRTTQVWDATVRRESDLKVLALFRCTQYLLAEPRGAQRAVIEGTERAVIEGTEPR